MTSMFLSVTIGRMTPIRDVPLAKLKTAKWNPRTISKKRFDQLCLSIKEDPGFLRHRPILAMKNGEIYAGNWRYLAAEKLRMKTVPAVLEDVSLLIAKQRGLKDNNSWGEYQHEELSEILSELKDEGMETDLLGFSDKELEKIVGAPEPVATMSVEETKPGSKSKVRKGQLWQLGENELRVGDAGECDQLLEAWEDLTGGKAVIISDITRKKSSNSPKKK